MFRFPRRPALAQKQLDAMEHTAPLPASYMRGGRLQYNYRASLFKSMLQGVVQLRYVLWNSPLHPNPHTLAHSSQEYYN